MDNGKEAKRNTVPFTLGIVFSDLSTPQRVADSTASTLAEFLSDLLQSHASENPIIVAPALVEAAIGELADFETLCDDQKACTMTVKQHGEAFESRGSLLLNVGIRLIAAAALYSISGQTAKSDRVSDEVVEAPEGPGLRLVKS